MRLQIAAFWLLAFTLLPLSQARADAPPFQSDFESCTVRTILGNWDEFDPNERDRLSVEKEAVRSGNCALALTILPEDGLGTPRRRNRAELKENINTLRRSHKNYAFSIYVPPHYPDAPPCGIIVAQWRPRSGRQTTITLYMGKEGDSVYFRLTSGVQGLNFGTVAAVEAEIGEWYDFNVWIDWSLGRDGKVDIWMNDRKLGEKNGPNLTGSQPYQFLIGQYAGKCMVSEEATLIFDNVTFK